MSTNLISLIISANKKSYEINEIKCTEIMKVSLGLLTSPVFWEFRESFTDKMSDVTVITVCRLMRTKFLTFCRKKNVSSQTFLRHNNWVIQRLVFIYFSLIFIILMKLTQLFSFIGCSSIVTQLNSRWTPLISKKIRIKSLCKNKFPFVYIFLQIHDKVARNKNFFYDFDICVLSRVGKNELLNICSLQFRKNFICMNLENSEENLEFLLVILVSIFSKELKENG